jgi:3,5-epimerase/4-reductase
MKWLVYGGKGWIGSQLLQLLSNEDVTVGEARVDSPEDVEKELLLYQPDRVVSLIGRTHGPGFTTIDYLEQKGKLQENIKDNLYSPLVLALLCTKYNIHFTYLGTGCIFNGYPENGYTEEDEPDFFGSSYSVVKGFTDRLMHLFPHALNVRIRMPIVDYNCPRNFITKIMTYKKICSLPNSLTVLPELLPVMLDASRKGLEGTLNLCNPGLISHNEILEMVKEYVDPEFTWENFTLEEQDKILASSRSNNYLCTKRLEELYPNVLPVKESLKNILMKYKK